MRVFGYINGKPVELDPNSNVEVVISRPQDDPILGRGWGGHNLVRMRVEADGKYTHCWLSARISGDSRAGSQKGVHLEVSAAKSSASDVRKEIHVVPYIPLDRLHSRFEDQ